MSKTFHILNGDALLQQLPSGLSGEKIVCRECFVDGPVKANHLEQLFEQRARFLATSYEACTLEEYHDNSIMEFAKIQQIQPEDRVNLWFEDDLFCQVNSWFVAWYLCQLKTFEHVYMVRPDKRSPYGFHAYSKEELMKLFTQRRLVSDLSTLAECWVAYSNADQKKLQQLAQTLPSAMDYVKSAVEAYIEMHPEGDQLGRPQTVLKEIIAQKGVKDFGAIFRSFQKALPQYGFGDLQVKKMVDEQINEALRR